MIENYEQLKSALDNAFLGKWSVGNAPKELGIDEEWIVLSFIDDIPTIADNKIWMQNPRYQIAFYSMNQESNIDSFFIDNELIYTNKQQFYIDDVSGYQTVYEILI